MLDALTVPSFAVQNKDFERVADVMGDPVCDAALCSIFLRTEGQERMSGRNAFRVFRSGHRTKVRMENAGPSALFTCVIESVRNSLVKCDCVWSALNGSAVQITLVC